MKIATTIATALAACVLLLAPATAQEPAQTEAAQGVISAQIGAFRSGDHDRAFGFAAPNLQRMFGGTDQFIAMVRQGYGPIFGANNVRFGRSRMDGETLFQEVLLTGPKGKDWSALYTMRQEKDGSWRIHGVQMREAQLQST